MTNEEAKQLVIKYNAGLCTDDETAMLDGWYRQLNETNISEKRIEEIGDEIRKKLHKLNGHTLHTNLWTFLTVAAMLSLITLATFLYLKPPLLPLKHGIANDIAPGGNKATLTFANGKTINLSDTKTGIKIDGDQITYNDGTAIFENEINNVSGLATISTPKGGEYHIVLSDGTKVWLNAATTLQYPAVFRERIARKVRLVSGEAYFEVSKNKNRPFVVTTGQQDVLVLGTHFNINAYETGLIKTTLLEGSVRVRSTNSISNVKSAILVPGEQSIFSGKNIAVINVDVDVITAWKKGNIEFENADLQTVIEMLERWYDVEISYQGEPITTKFTGSISRSRNISEVLKFLESTGGIHFKIQERKVLMMK